MNPAKWSARFAGAVDLHQFARLRGTRWPQSTASEQAQELALILAGTGAAPTLLLLPATRHMQLSISSRGRQSQVTSHAMPITRHEPRVTSHQAPSTS
jgi:hypothetical protein